MRKFSDCFGQDLEEGQYFPSLELGYDHCVYVCHYFLNLILAGRCLQGDEPNSSGLCPFAELNTNPKKTTVFECYDGCYRMHYLIVNLLLPKEGLYCRNAAFIVGFQLHFFCKVLTEISFSLKSIFSDLCDGFILVCVESMLILLYNFKFFLCGEGRVH